MVCCYNSLSRLSNKDGENMSVFGTEGEHRRVLEEEEAQPVCETLNSF